MSWYVVLLGASALLVLYSYMLYPLLLWVGTRFIRRPAAPAQASRLPRVSIVVAAHNEEQVIEEKIRNMMALDYPEASREFLIGSDGSSDRTDEICRRYPSVTFERIEPRRGKANVLNTLIPKATGEIIVLSDANTIMEPGAVSALIRHFDDPTVGGVCGRLVLVPETASLAAPQAATEPAAPQTLEDTEQVYWGYESRIKELESQWYSTIGANGGIYAIRKALFVPIPTDTIIDDFVISMNLLEQGRRLVFEPHAIAREHVSKSFKDEFRRKVRIGAGNLQQLLRKPAFIFRMPAFVSFAYISHKVVRWVIPLLLIVCWISSLALARSFPFGLLFLGLNLSILLAVLGLLGVLRNRIAISLAYLYSLNVALLVGYGRYLLGMQRATWRSAQR